MKKETIQTIIIIAAALLMCCAGSNTNTFIPDYKNGDVLLPDYAHSDTLIVTDAERVNYLFMKSQPATDGEISEALGEGTRPTFNPNTITPSQRMNTGSLPAKGAKKHSSTSKN